MELPWLEPLRDALESVVYKDWKFNIEAQEGIPYLQITFVDPNEGLQRCRMWLLYPTMNRSEVVRTAWMAVLAAEEHEARERFRYKGVRVFAPHFDVDELREFYKWKRNLSLTEDPHFGTASTDNNTEGGRPTKET